MAKIGTCSSVRYGIGAQQCIKGNPLKMFRKPHLAVPGFTFDTFADFQDKAKWDAAIAAKQIFPLESIDAIESANIEATIIETGSGVKKKNKDGKYGFIIDMEMSLAQNKIFQGYGRSDWTLFIADDAENIIGQSPDGVVVGGLTISYFDPMPMDIALGSDSYSKTKLEIQLKYNKELNEHICVALGDELDWSPSALSPLASVEMSNVAIAANVITFGLFVTDKTIASIPSVAIRAIEAANLSIIDQAGLVVTPTGVTETTTPGIWEATTPAMTGGTIQLIPSVGSLFESEIMPVV